MKKLFSLFVSFAVFYNGFCQSTYTIIGKVIHAETKLPMQRASVFAQNTTMGTTTDENGNFTLRLPKGGYDLIITFTGFDVATRRITTADADNNIIIELKQKENTLQDVVIKTSNEIKDGWEKYGNFFLENFIGKTANSTLCSIKNKAALKFYFSKKKNRLKIMASEPLEVVNEALGYTIQYTLDSFVHEYNTHVSLYTGYPLFKETESDNKEQMDTWKANREAAYYGSMLHFMRSLYDKQLQEEGFEIQFLIKDKGNERAMPVADIYGSINYIMDDSSNVVSISPNQAEVAVMYIDEESPDSYLAANPKASAEFQLSVLSFFPNEPIGIEQNGYYYDQDNITINGYWNWEKVADMLPYDFELSE